MKDSKTFLSQKHFQQPYLQNTYSTCTHTVKDHKTLKEPQTISVYWFYLLCNHVAASTKSKLFVTYTFVYP